MRQGFWTCAAKVACGTSSEWAEVFKAARVKPNPFDVIEIAFDFFKCWTTHFSTRYKKMCPMKVRPIRELKGIKDHQRLVYHHSTWNDMWESAVLIEPKKKRINNLPNNEFKLPGQLYKGNYAHNQAKSLLNIKRCKSLRKSFTN